MKRLLLAAVLLVALPLGQPPESEAASHGSKVHPGGTFIVGDSTTYRVSGLLRERAPDWYLDYHWGRSIKALPQHVKSYLKDDPNPSNFVMALGTNWCHDPEWSESRLRRAIRLLPPETNVFLVMVVRAGRFQVEKDRILQRYNRYSRNLARSRPHTFIIDWRGTVLADPTLDPVTGTSSLLEDGTHQTGSPHGDTKGNGTKVYVDLIIDKWAEVNGLPAG